MKQEELNDILEQHQLWLKGAGGKRVNFYRSNLRGANLRGANLREATLREATLREANLTGANLRGANLTGANLRGANLRGANLTGANLREANLREATLREANLTGADLPDFQICPKEGSFIAWKKLSRGVVAKIEVPVGARRTSSLIGRKCRAEFIKVIEFIGTEEIKIGGWRNHDLMYEVGRTVYADEFDDDIRIECTNGIHFFTTKEEAERWM